MRARAVLAGAAACACAAAAEWAPSAWPVLKTYDAGHLRAISLPLGGIGTDSVGLGGRGNGVHGDARRGTSRRRGRPRASRRPERNPFSEPECGHYYGRSLASWGVFRAWTAKTGN